MRGGLRSGMFVKLSGFVAKVGSPLGGRAGRRDPGEKGSSFRGWAESVGVLRLRPPQSAATACAQDDDFVGGTDKSARRLLALAGCLAVGSAFGQSGAVPGEDKTFFEFGSVYSIGQRSVELRVYDQEKHAVVQHSFQLSKDTRADVVRVGDVVEVIYTAEGSQRMAQRVIETSNLAPKAAPAAKSSAPGTVAAAKTVPRAGTVAIPSSTAAPRASAAVATGGVSLGKTQEGKIPAAASVELGATVEGKVPTATALSLGGAEASTPKMFQPKMVAYDKPAEECHRSDASWASQPIRLGVMDFRYPTEKEDAADMTAKGGGSGTLVADLVFDRLGQNPDYALARGDRDKLYRGDFAGAARLGRLMGVDAVLAGTFQPVPQQVDQDGFTVGPKFYELKAGLVDTCTGQLLMRLVSVKCADGSIPDVAGPSGPAQGCKRYSVTQKQASDPRDDPKSFGPVLDALVGPLVSEPTWQGGSAKVSEATGNAIRIAGLQAKVGDTIAIHATRLAKNISTDTLRDLSYEEIGRVVVTGVAGGVVTGTFSGDYAPKVGDEADLILPQ
jgi:ribosomal protein S17